MDKTGKTIQSYDLSASNFLDKFMDLKLYGHFIDGFCGLLKPSSKVLDLGCGPGNVTKRLIDKNLNFRITGLDLSEQMIRLAQSNVPDAEFKVCDIRHIGTFSGYDAVIASFCIVHLDLEETEEFIRSINKTLNNQGFLYLSFIKGDNHSSFEKTNFSGQNEIFFNYFKEDLINDLLIKNNFSILNIYKQEYPGRKKTVEIFIYAKKTFKDI